MKIYFAGSIRGGREDSEIYLKIINHLKQYGEVLTEHVGDKDLKFLGEDGSSDNYIHDRDLGWILQSDILIAEVSKPSLGVGYEIGRAVENGKNVLCLYRTQEGKRLSAMISGCPEITNKYYKNFNGLKKIIDTLFK
tara:strand:+ start:198 stop:608 length:411 start_codon:yes stop_codon:yes gene_type:complete